LRASSIFNRRDFQNYAIGIAALAQALELDPRLARGHSRKAALHYVLASNSAAEGFRRSNAQARSHAERRCV
jgi:hypothetical protein